MANLSDPEVMAAIEADFKIADTNGDGVVEKQELKNLLEGAMKTAAGVTEIPAENQADVDAMIEMAFSTCDANADGKISFAEFVQAHKDGKI